MVIELEWTSKELSYEGQGTAVFDSPHGTVRGMTRVTFDHSGAGIGTLEIQELIAEPPLPGGVHQLLLGTDPVPGDEPGSYSLVVRADEPGNRCISFKIETSEGVLEAVPPIGFGHRMSFSADKPATLVLTVQLFNAAYKVVGGTPAYWLLPLTNFRSRYIPASPDLASHPLRLRHVEGPLFGEIRADEIVAHSKAVIANSLIEFDYLGEQGYIEPLLDWKDREQRLTQGRDTILVTAVMVGKIGQTFGESGNARNYLPIGLLRLLSLATGSHIGAPWIELYDQDAVVTERTHPGYRTPIFQSGRVAIDHGLVGDLGQLIAEGSKSDYFKGPLLESMAYRLVSAGSTDQTIEERVIHIASALDELCKLFRVSGATKAKDRLNHSERTLLDEGLRTLSSQLKEAKKRARNEGREESAVALDRVLAKIKMSGTLYSGFPADVAALIRTHGFVDLEIVDEFFRLNPVEKSGWVNMIAYFRSMAVHNGYIDLEHSPRTSKYILIILRHAYDLCLRMMLKRLTYTGLYNPPVLPFRSEQRIEWVTADTTPERLGYKP